jgi:hypothetical protein
MVILATGFLTGALIRSGSIDDQAVHPLVDHKGEVTNRLRVYLFDRWFDITVDPAEEADVRPF